MEPTSPRLDLLGPELLAIILEYVDDSSPATTKAVARTCKYLNSVVHLVGHRHKSLRIGSVEDIRKHHSKLNEWATNTDILVNLRTLTIDIWGSNFPQYPELQEVLDDEELWKPIADVISKLSRLKQLTWNLPSIPLVVLNALHTYHKQWTELRMFKFSPCPEKEPGVVDRALAKSPVLTDLRAEQSYSMDIPQPNMQHMAYRRIVALAPSLRYAFMTSQLGGEPYIDPADKVPFETWKKPNKSVRKLTLDGISMTKATLDDWGTVIDLSRLRELKFSRGYPRADYFQHAATLMPNLKHVRLNLSQVLGRESSEPDLIPAIQNYLVECSPLETLSLWSWRGVVDLDAVLSRHASTLQALHLHEPEEMNPRRPYPRKSLTMKQLKMILNSCKQLKVLTMDLNRPAYELKLDEKDSNMKYFKVLRNHKLEYLQIYFDLGLPFVNGARGSFQTEQSSFDSSDDEDEVETNIEQTRNDGITEMSDHSLGVIGNSNGNVDQSDPSVSENSATKRIKSPKEAIEPSTVDNCQEYVDSIWKVVFSQSFTASKLDVKFGEWEKMGIVFFGNANPADFAGRLRNTYFTARPAERDDQKGQCTIHKQQR